MARLIQISDPHVSFQRGFFVENFRTALSLAKTAAPDLLVISGDLTIDGADSAQDLAFCRHLVSASDTGPALIPGNHDVGEEPGAIHTGQPVSEARLARWHSQIGPDRFSTPVGQWRAIGLNAHLFGTQLAGEEQQWRWLEQELIDSGDAPVALFLHKPLFIADPDETTDGLLSVPAGARDRLMGLCRDHDVRLVGSGHLHQGLVRKVDGITHVWAPSTAFESKSPKHPHADVRLGFVDITLSDDGGCEAALVHAPQLEVKDYEALKQNGRYAFLKDVPPVASQLDWAFSSD